MIGRLSILRELSLNPAAAIRKLTHRSPVISPAITTSFIHPHPLPPFQYQHTSLATSGKRGLHNPSFFRTMDTKLDLESSRGYATSDVKPKPHSSLARNMGRVLLTFVLACFLVTLTNARRCTHPQPAQSRVDKILSETPLIGE